MKKLFFASALVAGMGMLGSCSNDDVAGNQRARPGIGIGNGLVPVELALNGPHLCRLKSVGLVPSATLKDKKPINGWEKSYTF